MRILQVIPALIKGGAERLALNTADELEKLGHQVLVVALRDDNRYPELSADKVRVVNANVYYSLLKGDVVNIDGYESIVDEFKPDVIHSNLIDAELVTRFNPRKGVGYITHWHGCPSLTNPVPFSKRFNREYIWKWNTKRKLLQQYQQCQNHFLCVSGFMSQYVQANLDVDPKDITVIHNAIDLERFRPMGLKRKQGFRLIRIGSLQVNKDHPFVFRVVRELIDQGLNDVYLDVYGEGSEQHYLESLIDELKLREHVKLHGIVSDIEVQLNRSHLLVHSAWHEAFGLIFIEAMACGIPVVTLSTGGPKELIKNGETGFLLENGDLKGFTAKVRLLYENRELLETIGKKGIEHAADYGIPAYAKKIETVYTKRLAEIRK